MTDRQLALKSLRYRRSILHWIKHAGAGHTGGSLSCVDILNVLYNRILRVAPTTFSDPKRDRYIQSKGHSVEALFVVLADRGFFPESDLATLCGYQSDYVGHPTRHVAGIEQNTGATRGGNRIADHVRADPGEEEPVERIPDDLAEFAVTTGGRAKRAAGN